MYIQVDERKTLKMKWFFCLVILARQKNSALRLPGLIVDNLQWIIAKQLASNQTRVN